MNFADAVAFIAGGASGLGEAVASAVVAAGGRVVICDQATSAGGTLARTLGNAALFTAADVTDSGTVDEAIAAAVTYHGRVDFCLNAAGIAISGATIDSDAMPYDLNAFRRVIDVNLIGSFDVCRLIAPVLARNKLDKDGQCGVIVNISSIAGLDGAGGQIAYVASKAAIAGMTLSMARELAPWGIRVVAICPGVFDTPMLAAAGPEVRAALAQTPAFPRRLGAPAEFVRLVRTIVETPMLNGEVIRLDGGARLVRA
jgi:NAD(P)-dependent dehydrogenase (short-subunit alcohol dehydrogenase family)